MSHTLDHPSQPGPSHPSYQSASSGASTLTRLAHLLQKDVQRRLSGGDPHASVTNSAYTGTTGAGGGHSRTQSDESDWAAGRWNPVFAGSNATVRRNGSGNSTGLGVGIGQRFGGNGRQQGDSGGSSSDDRDRDATIRGRSSGVAAYTQSQNHPYGNASSSAYARNGAAQAPGTPLRAPTLKLHPPTPNQAHADHSHHGHPFSHPYAQDQSPPLPQQQTPPRRTGPSFFSLDQPGIGESPKPSPLKPSKSAAAVARFRATAARHDRERYGPSSAGEGEGEVVPFYSTNAGSRGARGSSGSGESGEGYGYGEVYGQDAYPNRGRAATLPASTLSVITSTAALEAAGLPPTPPHLQGDFGTATVFPPMRVSAKPPLSPPQEPTRLSGGHPYAMAGLGVDRGYGKEGELSPRRVRSQGNMLGSAYEKPTTPPKSPIGGGPYPPMSFVTHPYAPGYMPSTQARAGQTSAITTLASHGLPIPPLRVPRPQQPQQNQNSGHPFADPTFRRQRLDSNPSAPDDRFATWTGRNRSQTNLDLPGAGLAPPVPTHWRHQALRPSASAFDLRGAEGTKGNQGLGLGFPRVSGGGASGLNGATAAGGHWHLFPRLAGSKSHGRLKPSTSTFATSNGAHTAGAETQQGTARTDGSHQSLQVRTACDALVFPRPRLRPHEISPPDSPNGESPLFTPGEWARAQRLKHNLRESDPVPTQPRSAFLQRVLAEGQQRERERIEWAAAAERGQLFHRKRAKSMPRSRVRPARLGTTMVGEGGIPKSHSHSHFDLSRPSGESSRGAVSDSEDSRDHWWGKKKTSGENLGRNPSTGSRVLRKPSNSSVGARERTRTESMPPAVDPRARTTATTVANGAMVARGDSLLRKRNVGAGLNGHPNGHGQGPRMEPRNTRAVRTSDDLPLVDIRAGAAQAPVPERQQPKQEPRPRVTTTSAREQVGHTALHGSLPPSPQAQVGVALSTPLIHPHIPHPYAAMFGAASASDLPTSTNTQSRPRDAFEPPLPSSLTAGPHPIEPERPHPFAVDTSHVDDVAMRHRMPPRLAQHGSPPLTTEPKKRSPRVPVPSYYSPALPPMLQEALEASDDGREFLASIDGSVVDEQEVEGEQEQQDAPSRASTPRADQKRRGHQWNPSLDRALLIAAGLNPSPSPETGAEFFSDIGKGTGKEILAPPLNETILNANVSRTTLEDEGGFVTASEGPFGESKEELGQTVEIPNVEDLPEIPSMPGSSPDLPGNFYAHPTAYRSANTLASSMLLPTGVSPRFPFSPASPNVLVPSPNTPNIPRSPSTPGNSDSPGDAVPRAFPMSRGSSGEASPRPSPRSPRSFRGRTFSYGSRDSSDMLDPPAPLGGLDQIEAQMFKDLYYTPAEDIDPGFFDEQLEAELNEARAIREQERRDRERERKRESDAVLAPAIEVSENESEAETDAETEEHMQPLPKFSTPTRHVESESEQYLTPAETGSRSRRPSSERAETPVSDYNDSYGHGDDDIRVGEVGEIHVPEPTTAQIRHLSLPLSVIESEGTEHASTVDPSSPKGRRIISLTAATEGRLSIPSTGFDGARHSHLTGVSMGTSNTSGNDRMSGLLSDFPQPPEDQVTPSFTPSSFVTSSYYTPTESLDEFPLELRMGESPTVRLATLRPSEVNDSPGRYDSILR